MLDDLQRVRSVISSMRTSISYEDIVVAIEAAPLTWLPALMITAVEQCVKRKVFKDLEALLIVAKKAAERAL